MNKERTTVSLDADLLREARNRGINVSGICEDALKNVLLTFDQESNPETCQHKWTFAFCTPYGLAKECLRCQTIKKVVVEGTEKKEIENERM